MSSHLIILGAGASAHAGAPLMRDFLKAGIDRSRGSNLDLAIERLQILQAKFRIDLEDLEEVISLLDMAVLLDYLPGQKQHGEALTLRGDVETLVATTIEQTMRFPTAGSKLRATADYGKLAKTVQRVLSSPQAGHRLAIITLNYDIGIDLALALEGMKIEYGLSTSGDARAVPLFKLHGSPNWGRQTESESVEVYEMSQLLSDFSPSNLWENPTSLPIEISDLARNWSRGSATFPLIVAPSWSKTANPAIAQVWRRAVQHMNGVEHIWISGYSMPQTDTYVRHLLALGFGQSRPVRSLRIYNGSDPSLGDRLKRLVGSQLENKIEQNEGKFSDMIIDLDKSVR